MEHSDLILEIVIALSGIRSMGFLEQDRGVLSAVEERTVPRTSNSQKVWPHFHPIEQRSGRSVPPSHRDALCGRPRPRRWRAALHISLTEELLAKAWQLTQVHNLIYSFST